MRVRDGDGDHASMHLLAAYVMRKPIVICWNVVFYLSSYTTERCLLAIGGICEGRLL